ncbi:hypothetical protein B0H21DRAFT_716324 [Amylocystis lapponica]|nr:hypothetical protein B0H21DRAFT_716324 [Amylocystis lapponica]
MIMIPLLLVSAIALLGTGLSSTAPSPLGAHLPRLVLVDSHSILNSTASSIRALTMGRPWPTIPQVEAEKRPLTTAVVSSHSPCSPHEIVLGSPLLRTSAATNSPAVGVTNRSGLEFLGFPSTRLDLDLPPVVCKDARPVDMPASPSSKPILGCSKVGAAGLASSFDVDALSPVRDGPSTGNDSSSVKDAGWSIPNSRRTGGRVSLRAVFPDATLMPDDGSTQYEDSYDDLSEPLLLHGTPLAAGALLEPCDQKTYRRTRRGRRAGKKHKNMSYESQRQIAEELEVLRLEADKLKAALDAGTLDEYDMDALGNLLASPYSSAAESSDEDSSPAPHRRRARRGAKILNDWDTESDLQTEGNPFAFGDAEAETKSRPRLSQSALGTLRDVVRGSTSSRRLWSPSSNKIAISGEGRPLRS